MHPWRFHSTSCTTEPHVLRSVYCGLLLYRQPGDRLKLRVLFTYSGRSAKRTLTIRLIAIDLRIALVMMAASNPSRLLLAATEAETIQCLKDRGYVVALSCVCQRSTGITTPATIQALPSLSSQQIYNAPEEVTGSLVSHHEPSCGERSADAQVSSPLTTPVCGPDDVAFQTCDPIDALEVEYSDDDDDASSSCGGVPLPVGHHLNQEGFATSDVSIHDSVAPSASFSGPTIIDSLANRYNQAKAKQERKDILEKVQCMGLAAEQKSRFLAGILDGGPAAAVLADRFRKTNNKQARRAIRKEVRRLKLGAIFEIALVPGKKR